MKTPLTLEQFIQEGSDSELTSLATEISNKYVTWKNSRQKWEQELFEIRNYLFATDTRTTQNRKLPHYNSTTIPKLASIRDNLYANYMAALFPNPDWLAWEGDDEAAVKKEIKDKIEALIKNRLRASEFEKTVELLILDYIDYGNAFAMTTWVDERVFDEENKLVKPGYVGPKLIRLSPYDIVFDISAQSFDKAAKILRTLVPMPHIKNNPEYNSDAVAVIERRREAFATLSNEDKHILTGRVNDGFGSAEAYLFSGQVELLEFEGDIYDKRTGTLYEDRLITIADRAIVLRNIPRKSLTAGSKKFHIAWRKRQDTLLGQGPLNNLVGMQYRIDHLENLRADVFDSLAKPQKKIKGEVADFDDIPGERIYIGEEGDVTHLTPDVTVLHADTQIEALERRMEEYAGAPREAMGIRTPGEKTAYEIQTLDNRASRVFQSKIKQFESQFLEPVINSMFILLKENFPNTGSLEKMKTESGATVFETVTAEDLEGSGYLYPRGARHFEAQARVIQNLTQFANSALGQDPNVRVHISGKAIAALITEQLGLDKYDLYNPNKLLEEQMETERYKSAMQQRLSAEETAPVDLNEQPVLNQLEGDGQQ